jgi:stage II sporulation protein D
LALGCASPKSSHTALSHAARGGHAAAKKSVSSVKHRGLNVLLRRGEMNLHLSSPSGLKLLDPKTGALLTEFGPGQKGALGAEQGRLRAGGRLLDSAEAELKAMADGSKVGVMGIHYRGRLILKASGDSLLLVNEVGLDSYLYGVLPSEVKESWPMEALKAQAVAARTYALFRVSSSGSTLYDLDDSTSSQRYLGTSKEGARSMEAVDLSSGLVLSYHDQLAQTFFHANCGGYTADSRRVWGSDLAYLRGVRDPFCEKGKYASWHCSIDHDQLLKQLQLAGHHLDDFESLTLKDRDSSGRWKTVVFAGHGAKDEMSAAAFRSAVGADLLRSTNFTWKRHGDSHEFEGHGWGHGIGLCQDGAEGMAKQGYSFRQIIYFYFSETKITKLKAWE